MLMSKFFWSYAHKNIYKPVDKVGKLKFQHGESMFFVGKVVDNVDK